MALLAAWPASPITDSGIAMGPPPLGQPEERGLLGRLEGGEILQEVQRRRRVQVVEPDLGFAYGMHRSCGSALPKALEELTGFFRGRAARMAEPLAGGAAPSLFSGGCVRGRLRASRAGPACWLSDCLSGLCGFGGEPPT